MKLLNQDEFTIDLKINHDSCLIALYEYFVAEDKFTETMEPDHQKIFFPEM
jgi:hypothetical protein